MGLRSRLRRLWHWLAEVPTFWVFLLVLLSSVAVPQMLPVERHDAVRYAGLLLQLLGIGVVAWTLRGRGQVFNHKAVTRYALEWLRRAPIRGPARGRVELQGTGGMRISGSASVEVWRGPRLDQPVEAQLEAIRQNLEMVRGKVDSLMAQTDRRLADMNNGLDEERRERVAHIREVTRALERVAADSLYVEVAGLWWLVIGIVLATAPGEVVEAASWFVG